MRYAERWIPACAGMTVRGVARLLDSRPVDREEEELMDPGSWDDDSLDSDSNPLMPVAAGAPRDEKSGRSLTTGALGSSLRCAAFGTTVWEWVFSYQ